MNKNRVELFNILNSIERTDGTLHCKFCNKEFKLLIEFKKHLFLNCFYDELKKRDNDENLISSNMINNSYNNCDLINGNNNTINNTYNIKVEIKNPVGFDNKWDLSSIDYRIKNAIALSQFMYTNLLEEILKNEITLNVIIDNENNLGMVYKNDIDKYNQMKIKDIVHNTMKKLNEHLIDINKNDKMTIQEFIKINKESINNKYVNFEKDENIQKDVENKICAIFENKKIEAINLAEKIMEKTNIANNGF